jgi:hypothetical protein
MTIFVLSKPSGTLIKTFASEEYTDWKTADSTSLPLFLPSTVLLPAYKQQINIQQKTFHRKHVMHYMASPRYGVILLSVGSMQGIAHRNGGGGGGGGGGWVDC